MKSFSIRTAVIRWLIGALLGVVAAATDQMSRGALNWQALLYGAAAGFIGGVVVDLEAYRTWLESRYPNAR